MQQRVQYSVQNGKQRVLYKKGLIKIFTKYAFSALMLLVGPGGRKGMRSVKN